jgi:hypothetical protein
MRCACIPRGLCCRADWVGPAIGNAIARGVNNLIRVWSKPVPSEAKRDIEKAFRRSAAAHVNRITLETTGETILGGTVRSWSERQEAQHAS